MSGQDRILVSFVPAIGSRAVIWFENWPVLPEVGMLVRHEGFTFRIAWLVAVGQVPAGITVNALVEPIATDHPSRIMWAMP